MVPSLARRLLCARRAVIAALVGALSITAASPGPAGASDALFLVTAEAELLRIRAEIPATPESRADITGLPAAAVPLALEAHATSGRLLLAARDGARTALFDVDPGTGTANRLPGKGLRVDLNTASADLSFEPDGRTVRILVDGKHALIDTLTGTTTPQDPLAYGDGDPGEGTKPMVSGLAAVPGSAPEVAIVLDAGRRALTWMGGASGPLADGLLRTAGTVPFALDARGAIDASPADRMAYVAATDAGEQQSNLYRTPVDALIPGYLGPFGTKHTVVGLAVGTGGLFDFTQPTYRTREADAGAELVVTRSGTMTSPADVTYETRDETAADGADYVATTGVLGFAPGQDEARLTVPVRIDAEAEGEETLAVKLGEPGGTSVLGFRRQTRISIVDGGVAAPTRAPAASTTPSPRPAAVKQTVAPRLSLSIDAPALRTLGRTLRLPFRCTTACRVRVDARLDRASARKARRAMHLGSTTRSLSRPGAATVTIKTERWRKSVRRIRRGIVTYTVRAYTADGTPRATLKLKSPIRR
ncbi:DUF4394 domain-containing protein [Svornostia abyssi]|uniref:DUF4394 domain-containing protein n=1 Tax=Svornostia abyssi TaxID=2898438 RepID=A0ABY5PGB1_9ACTN|nr:DUF4394 domain-containing protein [Parviterribacteraceae bacterium J379]